RLRLSLPPQCDRARRFFPRLAGRGALAANHALQLFVPREGAARAVRRLGVRRVLLAASGRRPALREPAHRGIRQLDRSPTRAERLQPAGALPGGASRSWYSGLPRHRGNDTMIGKASMRRFVLFAAAWCTVFAAGHAAAQTRELGGSGVLLDGIAAVVDDGIVLKSEFEERLALVLEALRRQQAQMPPQQRLPLPPLSEIEDQVLEQLIIEQVQLQRAERRGIQVSDQVLNQALSNVAQSLGLTLEQLPAALAAQAIDYAAYREERRRELILDQLEQREVLDAIRISPRELELCLERLESSQMNELDYNVSHILIDIPSGNR